jgi:hypothetical protein
VTHYPSVLRLTRPFRARWVPGRFRRRLSLGRGGGGEGDLLNGTAGGTNARHYWSASQPPNLGQQRGGQPLQALRAGRRHQRLWHGNSPPPRGQGKYTVPGATGPGITHSTPPSSVGEGGEWAAPAARTWHSRRYSRGRCCVQTLDPSLPELYWGRAIKPGLFLSGEKP